MERLIEHLLEQYTRTQQELSGILKSGRQIADHLSKVTQGLPFGGPQDLSHTEMTEESMKMNKQITAYLNSLSELEDALNQKMQVLMSELNGEEDEGE